MPLPDDRPPLILLIGPTAVGKTELSLRLAERLGLEIISADSRLFYRGMDIGTAKPGPEDRARVPHHLIDFLNPEGKFTLAEFQHAVHEVVGSVCRRGRAPLMVGGSGQYVRAITEGWRIPASQPAPRLRAVLEAISERKGTGELHRWLTALDPEAARSIDHRNVRRTIRALEVILCTGQTFSGQRLRGEPCYRTLVLGLTRPRVELYERIDRRIERMLAEGLVDEVRDLLANGYGPDLPSMSAIGYREMARHVLGEMTLEEAVRRMKKRTRTFVRRQANWFKFDDPQIHWFQPGEDIIPVVEAFLRE